MKKLMTIALLSVLATGCTSRIQSLPMYEQTTEAQRNEHAMEHLRQLDYLQ
ncbi:hypothetical protein [Vibrio sp. WXL210]|uniref:hypothetical protein n=1 Tax=Vibrio sp. WXL210 TaxID=3450709 RepID=UPI003EC693E6